MALQRTRRPRFRSGRSLSSLGSPLNARPLGRLSTLVFLIFGGLSTSLQAGENPSRSRVVHWRSDIRPALESVICVTLQEQGGNRFFQPSISEPPECPGPLPSDQLLAQVAQGLSARGMVIRARVGSPQKAFEGMPVDAEHRPAAQQGYRTMVLSDAHVQRRLMPRLHQLLVTAGATCPDCPGPRQLPEPQSVKYADLMPYVLAYLWPVKVEPDGGVSMQICAGANGIKEMTAPDPTLADAGFELVFGNWDAIGEATRKAREAARSPDCKKLDPDARLAYVRRYLKEALPADPSFREALRPATQYLPEIGLACSDCS